MFEQQICTHKIRLQKPHFVHNQKSALTVFSRCLARFWVQNFFLAEDCRIFLVGCPHTCVLVPDVAVEDFSQNVENTDHHSHRTEKDDSSQGSNALQHRVHPHTCHVMDPTRPGPEKVKVTMHSESFLDMIYLTVVGAEDEPNFITGFCTFVQKLNYIKPKKV